MKNKNYIAGRTWNPAFVFKNNFAVADVPFTFIISNWIYKLLLVTEA